MLLNAGKGIVRGHVLDENFLMGIGTLGAFVIGEFPKAVVMVLGLLGHASMWMAVFADSGVAMLCVLNSIRMLYKK